MDERPRIAILMSSARRVGTEARVQETGAYLPEVAHAWQVFDAAGFGVDLVSVRGGQPPLEAVNRDKPPQGAFLDDPEMAAQLTATTPVAYADPTAYAALFIAGGHGAAVDLPDHPDVARLIRHMHEDGRVVSAVCHGPAALVNVRLSGGEYLVAGKQVAAFTNDEERAVGMTRIVPFLLADRLVERGADHRHGLSFIPFVVSDERLVTGQNPASAREVAEHVVELLKVTPTTAPTKQGGIGDGGCPQPSP
jgi:putative intracellular protease/amidase